MGKYQNPINKPEMVTLPRWEYARLVAAKTKLDAVEKIVNGMESYSMKDVLKLLLTEEPLEV